MANLFAKIPRYQVALIAVLLIVLISVILGQSKPPEHAPTEAAESAIGKQRRPSQSEVPRQAYQWPHFSLEEALAHDPFAPLTLAPPATLPKQPSEAISDRHQLLEALQTGGVRMIVKDAKGAVALIGSRLVRVGEVIEGFRVVAIDHHGVTLVEATQ